MTVPVPEDDLTRLVTEALASSEAEEAPPPLRARVIAAARGERPPGRPAGVAVPSPVEAYRRTVAELDEVLASCEPAGWVAIVEPYGWTVQGLVGHLLTVERLLGDRLGVDRLDVTPEVEADHIGMTQEAVAAQAGRDPAETLADWRAAAGRVLDALGDDALSDQRVTVHGFTFRWHDLLVVRSLEVWTHTDDVRRAVGRPLVAPDQGRMALMTDFAVRTLPGRLAAIGRPATADAGPDLDGVVRIVLTGDGGGVWVQAFGSGDAAGRPDVRIVADAVDFCRLSAGRLTSDQIEVAIDGDLQLGTGILTASAAFAM
jgi:uncharacterized protein (TIGR03083 family)